MVSGEVLVRRHGRTQQYSPSLAAAAATDVVFGFRFLARVATHTSTRFAPAWRSFCKHSRCRTGGEYVIHNGHMALF